MSLRAQYCAAQPFAEFLRRAEVNADLWQALTRRAHVPHAAVERVRALGGRWRLLVLADDWCGDATNTVPVLAKLAGLAENLDLRVVGVSPPAAAAVGRPRRRRDAEGGALPRGSPLVRAGARRDDARRGHRPPRARGQPAERRVAAAAVHRSARR